MSEKHEEKYAKLTDHQKWEWHAEVYAFRHVVLGVPLDQPSPCDEERKWFNERLVMDAVGRKQAKRDISQQAHRDLGRTAELEGRAAINGWARGKGHENIDAYALAQRITLGEAYVRGAGEIMAEAIERRRQEIYGPRHPRRPLDDTLQALGVTATERKEFSPSSERMAADRAALGIATCDPLASTDTDSVGR